MYTQVFVQKWLNDAICTSTLDCMHYAKLTYICTNKTGVFSGKLPPSERESRDT